MNRPFISRRRCQFEQLEARQLLSTFATQTELVLAPALISAPTQIESMQAAVRTVASVRAGNWSDPSTWDGPVPDAASNVVVRHSLELNQGSAAQLTIESGAVLAIAGQLHASGSVIVYGTLTGTVGQITFHVENDRLFVGNTQPGPDPGEADFHPEDVGLWVMEHGTLDIRAPQVTSWLNTVSQASGTSLGYGVTAKPAISGGSSVLSVAPVGWTSGDTLLLVNERGEHRLAKLGSVIGNRVTFTDFPGELGAVSFVGNVLAVDGVNQIASKIANLSRRFVIDSGDVTAADTTHRAHIVIMHGAVANMVNVEIRDLGPRGKLGRYPVHFHHGGATTGSLIGSSIWQDVPEPGNRFVALHDVSGIKVENNVAFRSQGNGFFMEQGPEVGNRIVNNMSVAVVDGEELPLADTILSSHSHHFWLRAGNVVQGNVAAGGTAFGLILLPSSRAVVAPVVVGQESYGVGQYGMWAMVPNVKFLVPKAAYNVVAGLAVEGGWERYVNGQGLISPVFLFNGRQAAGSYNAQVYLNLAEDVLISQGIFAGSQFLHTHYSSTFSVSGSTIRAGSLLTPTYWEFVGKMNNVSIDVTKLFDGPYPIRAYTPGLLELVNSQLRVGGAVWESISSAYYMGKVYATRFGYLGQDVAEGSVRLSTAPASMGFVSVTISGAYNWRIWLVDETPPQHFPLSMSWWITPAQWQIRLAARKGFGMGIPAGTYKVDLFDSTYHSLGIYFMTVRSGEVTTTLTPAG